MQVEREHYPLLLAISASLFCTPLMVAGINAVLPELARGIGAGATELSLIGTLYSLGLAIFQLASGSLGDIFGHRRLFLAGAILFGISGAVLGFLHSIPVFLLLRLAQGIGGAMLSASGLALIAACAPPEKRPIYLGISGGAVYAGIACGPPIAGLVTGLLGWRWLFWGSALGIACVFMLMKYSVAQEWRPSARQKFDWQGCLLYSVAMIGLTAGAPVMAENALAGWSCLAVCLVFLIIFCIRELGCRFPMLNLKLLARNRVLSLSSLTAFVNYASFFGLTFYFGIYVQVGKGLSVEMTGLVLALQPLTQALTTPLASRLCLAWSAGAISSLGAALCGAGLIAGAFLNIDTPLWVMFLAQALLGSGMSFFALGNTAIIIESAGKKHIGQASALTGAVRTSGQLCSMVVITLTLSLFLGNQPVSLAVMDGFITSMHLNLAIFGVLNLAAVFTSLTRNRVVKKIRQ